MNTQHLDAPAPPDKDRSTWLVAFGVILLCFGSICALLTVLMVFVALAVVPLGTHAVQQGLQPGGMVALGMVYGSMAVLFISTGYGSIKARRWARSLILAVSWIVLVCGSASVAGMPFFIGDILKAMESQEHMPHGFGQTIAAIIVGTLFTFYVLIPGVTLLFYNSKNVKTTCEYRNPEPSWTDTVPLPVLIQVVLLAHYSVGILSMAGFFHWATPFFGVTLSGIPGAIAILSISLCCAFLARGCYRLQPMAWWGTVALVLFWGTSAYVTFARGDLMEYYTAMGMPEVQLNAIRPLVEGGAMQAFVLWATPLWLVGIMGFFAYTNRYFVGRDGGGVGVNAVD